MFKALAPELDAVLGKIGQIGTDAADAHLKAVTDSKLGIDFAAFDPNAHAKRVFDRFNEGHFRTSVNRTRGKATRLSAIAPPGVKRKSSFVPGRTRKAARPTRPSWPKPGALSRAVGRRTSLRSALNSRYRRPSRRAVSNDSRLVTYLRYRRLRRRQNFSRRYRRRKRRY